MTEQTTIETGASEEAETDALAPEEAARAAGWKPKEEFKGPADKWTDAQSFLDKRADNVGMLQDNVRRLERRLAETEKRVSKADRAGFERAMTTILEKQRQAVETGDLDAFDKAEKERKTLEAKPTAAPADAEDREEKWIEWRADNDWFGVNELLTEYANTVGTKLLKESTKEYLDHDDLAEISRRVKDRFGQKYPDLFGIAKAEEEEEDEKPRRRNGSPVAPVTTGRGKGGVKSAADLDARGKELGQKMVNMGLYKDLNEYAKELFNG